jgi:hypothetical protein
VRVHFFNSEAEMGREFVELNSQLVKMCPDDILRALEGTSPILQMIRRGTAVVGYDSIRRNFDTSPTVSMSTIVRAWEYSKSNLPNKRGSLGGVEKMVQCMTVEDAAALVEFVQMAERAFGRDPEYRRLWGSLNLTICMWLFRRSVLDAPRKTDRSVRLTKDLFGKCLMRLSASSEYLDWLRARVFSDEHRSPCYMRIKKLFSSEIAQRMGTRKVKLPEMG